ncbi:predicted protein [Aspergillus terreus NIH2624]|uniref:Uncharacterized protein n=1 Tax=Aspergillus terreus (strain NIH 2624 / FGSC A1156) TaxID=341663 RepID=Q0C8E5_ASPTN|nr:uncharacterized protein ATEG_10039 [Aspergillus terreus NIH2624]EAU29488.1 predicted protein [Aspergillus terreus NIH2624]
MVGDDAPQRRPGEHEARTAVGKDDVADLHLVAQVEGVVGIKLRQLGEQIRLQDIRVGLHEDVPLSVGAGVKGLVHHREELPFIEDPARVVGLTGRHARVVGDMPCRQGCFPGLAQVGVECEVRVREFDAFVDASEHVVHRHAGDLVLVVREEGVVPDAPERGVKVDEEPSYGFCRAGLEDNVDVVEAGGTLGVRRVWCDIE